MSPGPNLSTKSREKRLPRLLGGRLLTKASRLLTLLGRLEVHLRANQQLNPFLESQRLEKAAASRISPSQGSTLTSPSMHSSPHRVRPRLSLGFDCHPQSIGAHPEKAPAGGDWGSCNVAWGRPRNSPVLPGTSRAPWWEVENTKSSVLLEKDDDIHNRWNLSKLQK